MGKSDSKIIHLAKATDFDNNTWINLRNMTVYEAMRFCVRSKSFTLGYSKSLSMTKLKKMGYKGKRVKKDIIKFLVENKELDKLRIDYNKVFRGNYIRGKLRIQTYLILKGFKNIDKSITPPKSIDLDGACKNILQA